MGTIILSAKQFLGDLLDFVFNRDPLDRAQSAINRARARNDQAVGASIRQKREYARLDGVVEGQVLAESLEAHKNFDALIARNSYELDFQQALVNAVRATERKSGDDYLGDFRRTLHAVGADLTAARKAVELEPLNKAV